MRRPSKQLKKLAGTNLLAYLLICSFGLVPFLALGQETSASSEVTAPNQAPEKVVDLILQAKQSHIAYGEIFEVRLKAKAGNQPIDAVEAHLRFDPTLLSVKSIEWGDQLDIQLLEKINNSTGALSLAAGSLYNRPSEDVEVARIIFRAIGTGEATIEFNAEEPWSQEATYGGFSVFNKAYSETLTLEATTTDVDDVAVEPVQVDVFPNPSKGIITIDANALVAQTVSRIRITNEAGQTVFDNKYTGMIRQTLDLSKHGAGVYSIQLINGGQTITKNIIVQ